MEKQTPHYPLNQIKLLIEQGKVNATHTAILGAVALGLDYQAMLDTVRSLTHADFYKSMTSYVNHKIWQDVYRPNTPVGQIYLKLTVIDNLLIVSFKER